MIRKIFSISLIAILLSSNVMASTDVGLKKIFDELEYSLTVEWDQKDPQFYSEQIKLFQSKLRVLEHEGLTFENYLSYFRKEFKDDKVLKDMIDAFKVMNLDEMNEDQIDSFLHNFHSKTYAQGSSWNNDAVIGLIIGAVILVGIIYFLYDVKNHWPCYDPEIGDYRKCKEMYPEN